MTRLRRFPMLLRLGTRYARRHRGQTVRAILGLIVVSLVLTTGLGLGDSLEASLEASIEQRFGPVDVVLRSPSAANATLLGAAIEDPALSALGAKGAPTLVVTGSISNPARQRAEAFASLRGVDPREAQALGPLPGGAQEPQGEQVVLSQALAERLDARVGDRLEMRALPLDLNETLGIRTLRANGTLRAGEAHLVPFTLGAGALGVLANLERGDPASLRLGLRSPTGQAFPALDSGREVRALAPLAPGAWNLTVEARADAAFAVTVRVASEPPALEDLVVLVNGTVGAIVPTEGRAAIAPRPTALLPLGRLQDTLGLAGQANQAYLSSPQPAATAALLEQRLGNATWSADATKLDAIERVRRDAGNLSGFILVMGGFTIVASMLLAYVLFASLVEERRSELGIARALGLTRGEVAAAMLLEASIYAGIAAAVGAALGVLLLHGLLALINGYAAQFRAPEFFLHLDPLTLPIAVLGGALLPLATIAAGTLRFARLDPARAIRGSPEDVRVHRAATTAAGIALLAAGALLCLDTLWRLAGVGVAAGGLATLLLSARQRLAAVLASLAGLAYTLWSLYAFDDFPREQSQLDPVLTMLRALVVTLLATALLMASPRPARAAAAAFMRIHRLRRGAYVALRYLAARRGQAGLTAAMVAVVAVIVTVMGTLAATFAGTLARDEGGFELVGQSAFPLTTFPGVLPPEDAAAIVAAHFVPEHRPLGGAQMAFDGRPFREGRFVRFAGVAPGFAAANEYEVADRDSRFASSREAWQAVAQGTAVLASPGYFEPGGLATGGTLQLRAGRENRTYVVAGMLPDVRRGNLFIAHDDVRSMGFPQTTVVLVDAADGADAGALAHRLTNRFQAQGLAFESVQEEVQEAQDLVRVTVMVMQAFLLLGLFVGISATGFLATRAVHERRREIGTLRALGYEAPDVSRAFVLESTLVSAVGLALGVAVGLLVAHAIWWRSLRAFGSGFVLPWGVLAAFAAAVLALTAFASWRPSRQAARLDPSEALRYVE